MIPRVTLPEAYCAAWRPGLHGMRDHDILQWYHAVGPTLRQGAVVVEVGVYRGRSVIFLAELWTALDRHASRIYAVDPYQQPVAGEWHGCSPITYREALASMVAWTTPQEAEHIYLLRGLSVDAARLLGPASVDLVMIDGEHTEAHVLADIGAWVPTLRRGGIISGHDYGPDWPGVVAAVDRIWPAGVTVQGTVWAVQV